MCPTNLEAISLKLTSEEPKCPENPPGFPMGIPGGFSGHLGSSDVSFKDMAPKFVGHLAQPFLNGLDDQKLKICRKFVAIHKIQKIAGYPPLCTTHTTG